MFLKWNETYVECFCLKWCHHYDFMVCRKVFSLVKTRKMIIVYSYSPWWVGWKTCIFDEPVAHPVVSCLKKKNLKTKQKLLDRGPVTITR